MILENQRQAKLAELAKNTQNIHLVEQKVLQPELIIKEHEELRAQPWDGQDSSYPLTAQTPGIQQQLQQAIEQEYQQEHQQEEEQEQEQEQESAEYKSDEFLLITRSNIDTTKASVDAWGAISDEIKNLSGWQNGHPLSEIFSLWVGSEIDAANVIKTMEHAAVQKIMENVPSFRFAASRDNLPAGFYLAYSRKERGLILCYNRKREKEDLIKREQTEYTKRNHFTVQIYDLLKPNVFRGDDRQVSPLSKSVPEQKLLYKFLATADGDLKRVERAVSTLQSLTQPALAENASVQMQEYTISGATTNQPGALNDCLAVLKRWARTKINPPAEVLDALFDSANANGVLTEANLRAFWQLFYDHEVEKLSFIDKNASNHFFVLAQQIYVTFGPKHFETWKKYILDPSKNYSELLTKDEIDRVSLSIVTLGSEENKPLQDLWWAIIEAHGKSTGFVRYGH